MTDQYKNKLFILWAEEVAKQCEIYDKIIIMQGYVGLKKQHHDKSISEIQALMEKDGIDINEINKILEDNNEG